MLLKLLLLLLLLELVNSLEVLLLLLLLLVVVVLLLLVVVVVVDVGRFAHVRGLRRPNRRTRRRADHLRVEQRRRRRHPTEQLQRAKTKSCVNQSQAFTKVS